MDNQPLAPHRRRLALRTSTTRLLAHLVTRQASPALQAQLLTQLLRPVGPLALVAIAAGAFARLLPTTRWQPAQVDADDAAQFSTEQVTELIRYVEQKSPELLLQLPQLVADPRLWLGSASGALLLMALRARRQRLPAPARRSTADTPPATPAPPAGLATAPTTAPATPTSATPDQLG